MVQIIDSNFIHFLYDRYNKQMIYNKKIKTAPSVDKGRVLIWIVVTRNSSREDVKLNNRHTERTEFSSRLAFPILPSSFRSMGFFARVSAISLWPSVFQKKFLTAYGLRASAVKRRGKSELNPVRMSLIQISRQENCFCV